MVTAGRRVFYLGDTLVSYEREYVWAHDGVEWVVPVCEGALNELVMTLGGRKVACVKFSPSWTGMSFPACKGRAYADYSVSRLKTHPHDVTQRVEDWDNPDKGEMYTHARSLFKHIGRVSTQEYRNSEEFRALYAEMRDCECEQVIRV